MKVTYINKIFAKLGAWQIRFRWAILAAICALSVVCLTGLPKLTMASNEEDWFEDWEQVKVDSDHFKDIFGSDDSIMVLVQADDVFAPHVLAAIERLGERLENEVPYADEATSIMNIKIPVGTEDAIDIRNPFEDGIPSDEAQLQAKKDFILSRESLVNNIVSDDAKETWILLSLEKYEGGIEFATEAIARPAQKIILEEAARSDGSYTFKPTGMSYSEMEENDVVARECAVRVLSGFAVMLLCLILFVRSLRGVIVPLVATVLGIGSVLGLSAHLGVTADSNMITLPILLGMALSVGYSIHFVNSFRMHFRRTGLRTESVIKAVEETGWPILFTVITTVASLVSFLFAGIGPIRWVGGISSSIVFAVYLYAIVREAVPVWQKVEEGAPLRELCALEPAGLTPGTPAAEKALSAWRKALAGHAAAQDTLARVTREVDAMRRRYSEVSGVEKQFLGAEISRMEMALPALRKKEAAAAARLREAEAECKRQSAEPTLSVPDYSF